MRHIKKSLSKWFCLSVFLIFVLCGCADKAENVFEYKMFDYRDEETYGVVGYTKLSLKDVVIPSEYNGLPVTDIFSRAFYLVHMESVSMSSVIEIDDEAFQMCTHLVSVDLGNIEVIGRRAFYECIALKSVIIPKSVKRIEFAAFSYCPVLEKVYFEGAPEEIEERIFDSGVVIYGPAGSTVEEYAKKYNHEFISWEPDNN